MRKWKKKYTHRVCGFCGNRGAVDVLQCATLFKHEAQQISFIVHMDRIWCRLRQCVKQNTHCCKAHRASSQILNIFSFFLLFLSFSASMEFLFDFRSFYTRCEFYLMQTHTLTIVARHHFAIRTWIRNLVSMFHKYGIYVVRVPTDQMIQNDITFQHIPIQCGWCSYSHRNQFAHTQNIYGYTAAISETWAWILDNFFFSFCHIAELSNNVRSME